MENYINIYICTKSIDTFSKYVWGVYRVNVFYKPWLDTHTTVDHDYSQFNVS